MNESFSICITRKDKKGCDDFHWRVMQDLRSINTSFTLLYMTVLKIAHFHALQCPTDMTSQLQKPGILGCSFPLRNHPIPFYSKLIHRKKSSTPKRGLRPILKSPVAKNPINKMKYNPPVDNQSLNQFIFRGSVTWPLTLKLPKIQPSPRF
jgi:hypothetical protein